MAEDFMLFRRYKIVFKCEYLTVNLGKPIRAYNYAYSNWNN